MSFCNNFKETIVLRNDRTSPMSLPSTFTGMHSPWKSLVYTLYFVNNTATLHNSKVIPQ
jgi:hypothetical protein